MSVAKPSTAVVGSPAADAVLLEVRGLSISRRDRHGWVDLVDGVDLSLGRAEVLGVCGESGSGKTLTSLAVLGLLPAGLKVQGSIRYQGEELCGASRRRLRAVRGREIAVVWQDPSTSLHPLLSVGTQLTEHLRYHLGLDAATAQRRAIELLGSVRVPDPASALRARPHEFSGGLRQRIALAVALACEPKILLADEPTTALDVTVQAEILRLLRELVDERQLSVVLISHDLGVVSSLADRVQVMYAGRIVESGPRQQVIGAPRHPYTRALLAALPGSSTARSGIRAIPGSPPLPGRLPTGCAFHPRCAYAVDSCTGERPALAPVEGDLLLACPVDPFASGGGAT
jgi:oligopeptide/dipeptide ABC transporter ATP-binding protein